jgi:hypothetical protein
MDNHFVEDPFEYDEQAEQKEEYDLNKKSPFVAIQSLHLAAIFNLLSISLSHYYIYNLAITKKLSFNNSFDVKLTIHFSPILSLIYFLANIFNWAGLHCKLTAYFGRLS